MIFKAIKDSDLYKTRLWSKGERIEGASIFPFFGKSGQVKQLMILLPEEDEISMIPFEKGLVSISFFGIVKLSMDKAELISYSNFSENRVENLYHYDPGWTLSHERFAKHRARKLIKGTNCAGRMEEKISYLLFSRDLSSLELFALEAKGPSISFRTVKPHKLLRKLPLPRSGKSTVVREPAHREWRLDPIWNHWGANL